MATPNDGTPSKDTLLYWLAQACVEARAGSGASQEEVSALIKRLGISKGSGVDAVRRFEEGETWPRNPEAFLVAYSTLGSYAKPQELVVRGAQLWMEAGDMPDFPVEQTRPMMRAIAQMGSYLGAWILVPLVSASLVAPFGLAAVGVSLPDPIRKPFNSVGIHFPNQDGADAAMLAEDFSPPEPVPEPQPVAEKPAPPEPEVKPEQVIHPSPAPVEPPAPIIHYHVPAPQPIPLAPVIAEILEPVLEKRGRGKKKGLLPKIVLPPIELPPIELPPILEEPVEGEPVEEEPVEEEPIEEEETTPAEEELAQTPEARRGPQNDSSRKAGRTSQARPSSPHA